MKHTMFQTITFCTLHYLDLKIKSLEATKEVFKADKQIANSIQFVIDELNEVRNVLLNTCDFKGSKHYKNYLDTYLQ